MILRAPIAGLLALSFVFASGRAQAQTQSAPVESRRPRLTKPPELLEFVEAAYPETELAEGRAATVVLSIAISATGTVDEAVVVQSAGAAFDAAAVEAVRKFKFSPAEIDNQPAPVKVTYRYEFTPKVAAPTTGDFRGVVVAKGTGAPLAGVTVDIPGVGSTTTNDKGEFVFQGLQPGQIQVTLSREDLTSLGTQETVEVGRTLEARYDVELPPPPGSESEEEQDDFEIVVQAPRLVKQVVSTEVSSEEARRVPGTQGDVLKVVQNLPGVARASAGSGEVVVWGAAPQDTRTYVGNVRIPMLYHFGGLRSVMHNDRVAGVELIPGGYGAAYGRGLGGLVLVKERDPALDRLHGSAQLDVLDASAAITAPINDSVSFALTGRKSHIKELSETLSDQSFQQFFTLPNYYDSQGRLRFQLGKGESLELGGLVSGDQQTRTQPSSDPARRVSETRDLHFQRVDLTYRRQLDDGAQVEVTPWYGHDKASRVGNFGGVPTSTSTESNIAGFRAQWRGRVTESVNAITGFDFELVQSESFRNGSITSPPREGDPYVFGRIPADQVNSDRWNTIIASAAPYAEADWALFDDQLHITPGLRLEPYLVTVNRRRPADPNSVDLGLNKHDVTVQPRLSVKYSPEQRITFKGAVGLYKQPPLPDDLSSVFGNPTLGVASGTHFILGANYKVWDVVSVEATVFHTLSEELVARNPIATPQIGEALVQQGEGRSFGAQFLLRKDKGESGFFGWIAYTILRSERRDTPGSDWRLFDFDQTHALTALASYDLGAGFEIGARVRVASGYPRTPVLGSFYNARKNRYEPILGAYNTDRIPLFLQVDGRVAKRFDLQGTELEVYLDVQNVTNRENPEEVAYSPDFSEKRFILGLPILPVIGARWSF